MRVYTGLIGSDSPHRTRPAVVIFVFHTFYHKATRFGRITDIGWLEFCMVGQP